MLLPRSLPALHYAISRYTGAFSRLRFLSSIRNLAGLVAPSLPRCTFHMPAWWFSYSAGLSCCCRGSGAAFITTTYMVAGFKFLLVLALPTTGASPPACHACSLRFYALRTVGGSVDATISRREHTSSYRHCCAIHTSCHPVRIPHLPAALPLSCIY